MYKIGEFSKLTGLSVRALRYYDEIGLLNPEVIDEFTGYRYYSEENLREFYLINLLKNVDFSLEEIVAYKNNLTSEVMENKIEELRNKMYELEYKINMLEGYREDLSLREDNSNILTNQAIKTNGDKPKVRQLTLNSKAA